MKKLDYSCNADVQTWCKACSQYCLAGACLQHKVEHTDCTVFGLRLVCKCTTCAFCLHLLILQKSQQHFTLLGNTSCKPEPKNCKMLLCTLEQALSVGIKAQPISLHGVQFCCTADASSALCYLTANMRLVWVVFGYVIASVHQYEQAGLAA